MSKRSLKFVAVAAVVIAILSVVGYVYLLPRKEPMPQTMRWQTTDWKTLDPAYVNLMQEGAILPNIYNALLRYKYGTVELEPDLAERYEVSKDGLVYTFYLRRGVKFHKGFGTLTAQDVKYTFDRVLDPATKATLRGELAAIKETKVIDDYTVSITLSYPFAPFLNKIVGFRNGYIVSKKAVEQYGENYGLNPIGTGPFYWEKGSPSTEIVLKAFDDYWEGPPKLRQLGFKLISDTSVAYLAFEGKELDLVRVTNPETIERYSKDPKMFLQTVGGTNINYLIFNFKVKPFDDVRVRKAVNYAINKKALLETVLKGVSIELTGPVPKTVWAYEPNVERYDYNPEKAKQLLAEAGFSNGFSTTIYTYIGGPAVPTCTVVQQDLAKVGIKAELKPLEIATWNDFVRTQSFPITFQRMTRPEPDAYLFSSFSSKSIPINNYGSYNNSQVDRLIESGRTTVEPSERVKIYSQAQKMIVDEAAGVFLFSDLLVFARHSYVQGYKIDPLAHQYSYYIQIQEPATAKMICLPIRTKTKPEIVH